MRLSEERGAISRRTVIVFLSTFALTVFGFIGSTLVLRMKAGRILADSAAISGNAVPSIQRLSTTRTTLRHLEVTVDDYIGHSIRASGLEQEPISIAEDRRSLKENWSAYTTLPTFQEERALWPAISSRLAELDTALSALLDDLRAGQSANLDERWDRDTKGLFDQLDARIYAASVLNAAGSASAAADISAVETDLRGISVALIVLCALFALLAALVAVRLFRNYARITENQIANLELFAGRVAHDLRSPLSSVSLAVQFAKEKSTDSKTKSVLGRAHRTLQRTGELVDGLLLLAQLVRSRGTEGSSDLKVVLEDLVEELQPLAHENQIELRLGHVPQGDVACSAGVLANMVGNLIGNSIKYMGDSAVRCVTVAAGNSMDDIRIEVQDTGPGIPAEVHGQVFDVYARAAPHGISGMGLGLATVKRLADVLGGSVGLESHAGSGSVFWISLPKAPGGRKMGHRRSAEIRTIQHSAGRS
jgi:signal transduction histidine kinase